MFLKRRQIMQKNHACEESNQNIPNNKLCITIARKNFCLELPSFTVESSLTSPGSRSLSRQSATLPHLDALPPHDLVLWTDGSVPFPFGKGGSGVLANCLLCGTEATLSFSAGPVCSSFSVEACAILHALCWSR